MKFKHLLTVALLAMGVSGAFAQTWTEGHEVSAGTNYFLYNLGAQQFLADGMDWGTHATVENAGRVITLAAKEGNYSIQTKTYVNNEKIGYMTDNGYLDTGSAQYWEFTPVTEAGYTNVYTIKQSDSKYLYFNAADCRVNVGTATNTNADKWILVTLEDRQAAQDYTYLLQNTQFNRPWERKNWSGTEAAAGGLDTNRCGEMYNKTFDMYQTVTEAPNGKYVLSCQGFYRAGGGGATSADQNAKLYINSDEQPIMNINAEGQATSGSGFTLQAGSVYVPNSMADASTVFTAGHYSNNEVTSIVTNGTLKVGVKKTVGVGADWTIFDNFKLTYLGTCLVNDAIELPASGDMVADTWYYVDITLDNNYVLTATTLSAITCTNDGEQLTASATASPVSAEMDLVAGRYYVKSTSANNLSFAAKAMVYSVGEPVSSVADGKFTQAKTINVTFPAAGSTDPEANPALAAGASATINGTPVALNAIANGFSFDLAATLTPGTAYVVEIPADIYGFAGHDMNSAISLTINTPAVFDGRYFVRTADGRYISRGNNYNTRAIVDNYGVALNVTTNADGITKFQYIDNSLYLFDANGGNVYADNSSNPNWSVVAVTGGFNIINKNNLGHFNEPIVIKPGDPGQKYEHIVCANETGSVFTFEATAEHPAQMAAKKDAQAAAFATSAGLSASTKAELEALIDAEYNLENVPFEAIASGEKYQAIGDISKEIAVENGLYKVSVNAYHRMLGHAETWNARQEGYDCPTSSLYANGEEVQILSLFDQVNPSATQRHGNDVQYGGNYYPDRTAGGDAAFAAGNYVNEVYVKVTDGSLKFGIFKGNGYSSANWLYYANFKVERLTQAEATMAVSAAAQYGTFCAPFAVEVPAGVEASTAEITGTAITLTSVGATIPANTPVVLFAESGLAAETFKGKTVAGTPTAGCLTGVYVATPATVGSYVLQNNDSKVGFYRVAAGEEPTIGANRCYLTAPAGSNEQRAFFFGEEGVQTAIEGLNALVNGNIKAIYTLDGKMVDSLQKGVNVIKLSNGKVQKVIVK